MDLRNVAVLKFHHPVSLSYLVIFNVCAYCYAMYRRIANSNPSVLASSLAIVAQQPNYDCSETISQHQISQPAASGYTLMFANPLNNSDVSVCTACFCLRSVCVCKYHSDLMTWSHLDLRNHSTFRDQGTRCCLSPVLRHTHCYRLRHPQQQQRLFRIQFFLCAVCDHV